MVGYNKRRGEYEKSILSIFYAYNFSFFCVSSVKVMRTNSDSRLGQNEGYIVLRIINPTANRIIDEFFDVKGKRQEGIEPLH